MILNNENNFKSLHCVDWTYVGGLLLILVKPAELRIHTFVNRIRIWLKITDNNIVASILEICLGSKTEVVCNLGQHRSLEKYHSLWLIIIGKNVYPCLSSAENWNLNFATWRPFSFLEFSRVWKFLAAEIISNLKRFKGMNRRLKIKLYYARFSSSARLRNM